MTAHLGYLLYQVIISCAVLILTPVLLPFLIIRRYRLFIFQKFGYSLPMVPPSSSGKLKIWINTVSVGELRAVEPLLRRLREKYSDGFICLSIGTLTGMDFSSAFNLPVDIKFYYPIDILWAVKRVIDKIRPDIYITAEAEIWPNFISYAKKTGIKVALINGRISKKSYDRYRLAGSFISSILKGFDILSMRFEADAEHVMSLGASPSKVHITGNCKYDSMLDYSIKTLPDFKRLLNISPEEIVFVAGSTRTGEEKILLDVYKKLKLKYRGLVLIIAPRHIERKAAILRLIKRKGFKGILRTEIDTGSGRKEDEVVVLDTIGELFGIYAIAGLVFCGGSLVKKGGQNIVEPVIFGKVPVYGQYMDDFIEERELLEKAGAGIRVRNPGELYDVLAEMLADKERFAMIGEKGRLLVMSQKGAVQRNLDLISGLI